MRITALYTDDREMLEMFLTGQDIHKNTASIMYGKSMDEVTVEERQASKAVAFGLIYGESEFSFAGKNNMSVEEAGDIFNKFYSNKPAIKKSIDQTHEFVQRNGYVDTMNGHRRFIHSAQSRDKKTKNEGLRQSFNTIIQGTGGFLTNMAVTYIDDFIQMKDMKSKLVATVHDSIVVDSPPEEVAVMSKVIVHVMENLPYDFLKVEINGRVQQYPIEADIEIGLNYNDMVDYEPEEAKEFNSYEGYIKYKMTLQQINDYKESGRITDEQFEEKTEYIKNNKELFKNL